MRVVTLIENTTSREDLVCEHGLSLYVQTGNQKILFDTGQSGAFADNAQKLGIDLRRVGFVVLSHGHYDHGAACGGFWRSIPPRPSTCTGRPLETSGMEKISILVSILLCWKADG